MATSDEVRQTAVNQSLRPDEIDPAWKAQKCPDSNHLDVCTLQLTAGTAVFEKWGKD